MSTPHNTAKVGEIAKTVLMPGDPKRAEFIATTYLDSPVLVNDVRGVHGYTGKYKGVDVSVMASGMGMPSIGIYSWELFTEYDVDNIIRVGTAGAMQPQVGLMDIIIASCASYESEYPKRFIDKGTFCPAADFTLLSASVDAAKCHGKTVHVGNILSSDHFYYPGNDENEKWTRMGILACEMESAALYSNAAYLGKRALCICTVTDNLSLGLSASPEERQLGLGEMIEIALDTAAIVSV